MPCIIEALISALRPGRLADGIRCTLLCLARPCLGLRHVVAEALPTPRFVWRTTPRHSAAQHSNADASPWANGDTLASWRSRSDENRFV